MTDAQANTDHEVVEHLEEANLPVVPAKRGRKSNVEREAMVSSTDIYQAEQRQIEHLVVVDEQFGDAAPYNQYRAENEVRFYLEQGAKAYLEAGKRLILLKEHEGHGNFLDSLSRIGLGEDTAQRMMYTVRKLDGSMLSNTETFRHLSPSKLYEIALLETPDLQELAETGTVGGVTMDDIERMTTRELRESLRKERERRKQQDDDTSRMISTKNQKIDELERQIHLRPEPDRFEINTARIRVFSRDLIAECNRMQTIMRQMRDKLTEVSELPDIEIVQIRQFVDEVINFGTSAVIDDWEVFTTELDNLMPAAEVSNVH